MAIEILVADDHPVVRQGIAAILSTEEGLRVVGEAVDGDEVVRKALALRPDIVIMDVRMPKRDGIEAAKKIKKGAPDAKIVILTSFDTDEEIFAALEAKVDGYLLKDSVADDLVRAIEAVHAGNSFLHPAVAKRVVGEISSPERKLRKQSYGLSRREKQVLELMSRGLRNKEIAGLIWVSERSVKALVGNIMRKLKQNSRVQAVVFALQTGLVDLETDCGDLEGSARS